MPLFEVDLELCKTVTVTVDAEDEMAARLLAPDRNEWLEERGMRSRLRLLVIMAVRRLG